MRLMSSIFVVDCVCCANNCNQDKLYWCHGYLLVQNADCWPDTKCRRQTAEWVQNAECEFKEFFRLVCDNMSSYNFNRASRNRFSTISFHDYLHFCGIFLAHFFTKIDRNVISSLHIVFLLSARVGLCDVCAEFTNVIKADVDVNVMSLLNI